MTTITDTTTGTTTDTALVVDDADLLTERLCEAAVATLEMFSIHLGRRLGLYAVLADGEPRTAEELAAEAGIAPRYAREWLEQQAVAGFLAHRGTAADRRYRLGPEHARVLAHAEDPNHVAPFASMMAGIGQALPAVVEAYRAGTGVPYADYGPDFRDGQGGINRPAFLGDLTDQWIPAMPDVHERLRHGEGLRVADVGCGEGWSTIALARAYPQAWIDGVDADAGSVAAARDHLAGESTLTRVGFLEADVERLAETGPYDLVVLLETLHDLGRPVDGLRGIRRALADGGSVLVADERVAEEFVAPGDLVERMMFGWSVVHCLPAAMADPQADPTGTSLRPSKVRELAEAAGFGRTEILPIEHDFFRFYRLRA